MCIRDRITTYFGSTALNGELTNGTGQFAVLTEGKRKMCIRDRKNDMSGIRSMQRRIRRVAVETLPPSVMRM